MEGAWAVGHDVEHPGRGVDYRRPRDPCGVDVAARQRRAVDGRPEVGPPEDAPALSVQGVDGVVLRRDEDCAPEDQGLRVDGPVEGRRGPIPRHRGEVGDGEISGPRVVAMVGRPILP